MAYLTWPSALLFLGAGLLGLLVVEVQLASLHGVRNRAVQQANTGVDGITNLLANKINSETANASATFANDTNSVIRRFESDVNDHMLGWAGTTTTTLNNTLTTFYDGLTTVVNDTFGKTPLRDPALELLNCLIGSKVAGIQTALTFVHEHAHVDLPTVSPTALMITPHQTQDLVSTVGASQYGDKNGDSSQEHTTATSFVDRLIDRYIKALNKQRITYIALLACYLVVIIFGAIGIIWDHFQPPRLPNKKEPLSLEEKRSERDGKAIMANGSRFREESLNYSDKHVDSQDQLQPRAMTYNSLPFPPPPLLSLSGTRQSPPPLPPPLPQFNATNEEFAEEPVSKFSPITPSPSPGSKWPGGRLKH